MNTTNKRVKTLMILNNEFEGDRLIDEKEASLFKEIKILNFSGERIFKIFNGNGKICKTK